MAQVRIDLTGDANSLVTQIAGVTAQIRELQRSAADVYAMRGDAGMVGLQRVIQAATNDLNLLKDQFNQITRADVSGVVREIDNLDRNIKSASASASVFKQNLSTMASTDATSRTTPPPFDPSKYIVQASGQGIQDIINQTVGLDRTLKSAQTSATVLGRSLYAASSEDGIRRVTAAQQRETQAVQGTIDRLNKLAAARAEANLFPDTDKQTPQRAAGSAFGDIEPEKIGQSFSHGLSGAEDQLTKFGFGLRHLVAIFDESMRGQRGAMIASTSAMARDLGLVELVVRNIASPWTAVAAAGVAAAVAIGVAFEQMWQRQKTASETTVSALMKGGGTSPTQYKATEEEIERVINSTHEWAGNVRALYEELNKLPLAAQASREKFAELSKGLAGPGGDLAKDMKPLIDAMAQGAEEGAKFIEKQYNIKMATDGSSRSLVEQVAATRDGAQKYAILNEALEKNRAAILKANTAAREASQSWTTWIVNLGLSMAAMEGDAAAGQELYDNIQKVHQPVKDLSIAAQNASQAEEDFKNAVVSANSSITEQAAALTQLNILLSRTAQSAAEAAAQQNAIAKVDTMGASPGEQNRHRIAMDNIDEEAKKRQQDTEAQVKAAQARAAEILRTQTAKRTEAGQDPVQAGIDATSSEEYIKAQNEVKDAERANAKERVEIAKDAQRAIIQNEMIGTDARVAAQREVIRLAKQADADGIGSKREVAQEEIKLQTLLRQERTKTYQEARDNARAEVELAKGNVAEIMAAYDKLRAAAQTAGMPKAATAQINREEVRDLASAQSQAFSAATEFNSAQERLGNIQIASEKARLGSLVAAHQISREEMAIKEAEYTQKVMEENEKRIQSELNNDNLTKEQKEKLFEHLAELYEKDAELQIQAQEKATQAVEAENKRREAIFTKTFDAIGSEGEKAIEGLFDRSKTHKEVIQQFAQSVVKSIATSAAGELSEIGGQKLGPALGLTKEESKGGIGQVLGQSLFKAIGLEKEPAQDHLKIASDKMKSASEAQTKAAELQSKAAENLLKASEALSKFAGDRGVPGNFKEGTGTKAAPGDVTISGDAPAQAQAAVTNSFSVTGEKLKNYCATLVNESLEKAGVTGSGSGLASSFKNYGTAVSPGQVRAGDVFYSPPSGWGDTGHVGFTTGPVSDGRVPVMSSHMQGSPDNPAGPETRSTSNLIFRRPPYDESGGSAQTTVKLDPSSTQQAVATGVKEGDQDAASLTQSAVDDGVSSGNAKLVQSTEQTRTATDQNKAAIDKNTSSVDKNTTQLGQSSSGSGTGGGAGVAKDASSTHSGFQLLTQGLGIASTAAALFGSRLSTTTRSILGAVGIVSQLASFTKNLNDQFNLFGTATKAVTTATTLEQGAKTLNASATAVDTTAMQTNAAAATTSGGGGILGGLFKLLAFSGGGVVPSAAGGMMVGGGSGGTLSLLHPEEMVLPAHLSRGLQGMINRGGTDNSSTQNVLNYNANVTGYHPYGSRSEFEGMLRNNSSAMMDFMRNELKNGSYR